MFLAQPQLVWCVYQLLPTMCLKFRRCTPCTGRWLWSWIDTGYRILHAWTHGYWWKSCCSFSWRIQFKLHNSITVFDKPCESKVKQLPTAITGLYHHMPQWNLLENSKNLVNLYIFSDVVQTKLLFCVIKDILIKTFWSGSYWYRSHNGPWFSFHTWICWSYELCPNWSESHT